jgi:hypothetical protein
MSQSTDKQYDTIVQNFLVHMDKVKAPLEDFIAALQDARSQINVAITAAEQDLARQAKK